MKNIDKKVISYTTTNLILLITNIIVFAFQMNNPLNIKWLLVVYFVMAIVAVTYVIFIMIRVMRKHNEINHLSVRYKIFDWASFILVPISIFVLIFSKGKSIRLTSTIIKKKIVSFIILFFIFFPS